MALDKYRYKNKTVLIFMAIAILYAIPQLLTHFFSGMSRFNRIYLDSFISVNVERKNGMLEHYAYAHFPVLNAGDTVTAYIPIPENSGIKYPSISFFVPNSYFALFYKDQLLFEYTESASEYEKLLSGTYHEVVLPQEVSGHELRLVCRAYKDKAFYRLTGVVLQPAHLGLRGLLLRCLPEFLFFVSILFVSSIAFVCLIFYFFYEKKMLTQPLFFTIFSIVFSTYILSYYGLFNIFTLRPRINETLEYTTLYLLPLVFCTYYRQIISKRRNQIIIDFLIVYYITFFIGTTICHYTGIQYYYYFLFPSHVCMMVTLVCTVFILYDDSKNRVNNSLWNLQSGLIILLASVPLEIINFDIHKLFFQGSGYTKMYILSLGILYYIVSLFITSFAQVSQAIKDGRTKKQLEHLAYTDSLTRLMNRTKCEEIMQSIENEHLETYAIIFFDLNDLKVLNDTYGHEMGDIYLCSVANALYKVFGNALVCGRMGGDEFLVVLGKDMYKKVLMYIHDFQQQIQAINDSKVIPRHISVACGYVLSNTEHPVPIQTAYQQADKNMYENKRFLKHSIL
ncbi:MAG: GGDEF domain-containing protein [Treponema sp.]|nr:GGDEF domain-containing protein [Treponema sp.]